MLATNTQPRLTATERAIVKSYGGWAQFMITFGLMPYFEDDAREAKLMLESFAEEYEAEEEEQKTEEEEKKKGKQKRAQ
ncbi:hypothetical protein N7507_009320 [Penicillium longicatenatum]|nr:hypothetical protein N7507_009320 [Penicillium longicatenatum]